jgi:hypothetical protein
MIGARPGTKKVRDKKMVGVNLNPKFKRTIKAALFMKSFLRMEQPEFTLKMRLKTRFFTT